MHARVVTPDQFPNEARLPGAVLAKQEDLWLGVQLGGEHLRSMKLVKEELLLDREKLLLVERGQLLHHHTLLLLHFLRLRGHLARVSGGQEECSVIYAVIAIVNCVLTLLRTLSDLSHDRHDTQRAGGLLDDAKSKEGDVFLNGHTHNHKRIKRNKWE